MRLRIKLVIVLGLIILLTWHWNSSCAMPPESPPPAAPELDRCTPLFLHLLPLECLCVDMEIEPIYDRPYVCPGGNR